MDTPGVHVARSQLNRFMVREAMGTIDGRRRGADGRRGARERRRAVALGQAARRPRSWILERLAATGKPAVLCLNKVDHVKDKGKLLPLIEWWGRAGKFSAVVPTCATRKQGPGWAWSRSSLRLLPEGAPLYGPDVLTDRTERFLAGELVREQLFLRLKQELPYATAVVVENWEEREKGDVVIDASIVVERESQKAIVVGKGGAMIRDVGTAARKEITELVRPARAPAPERPGRGRLDHLAAGTGGRSGYGEEEH